MVDLVLAWGCAFKVFAMDDPCNADMLCIVPHLLQAFISAVPPAFPTISVFACFVCSARMTLGLASPSGHLNVPVACTVFVSPVVSFRGPVIKTHF